MSTNRDSLVLRRLVEMLGKAAGLDELRPSADQFTTIVEQDLFDGTPEICGRALDSLALTEVLVQVEEELDFALFDDERADEARSLADLVTILLSSSPMESVDEWLDTPLPGDE